MLSDKTDVSAPPSSVESRQIFRTLITVNDGTDYYICTALSISSNDFFIFLDFSDKVSRQIV